MRVARWGERRVAHAAGVLAVLVAMACGGGGSPSPPAPDGSTGGGGPSGGSGGVGAPSGAGGDTGGTTGDGGSGGGAPSAGTGSGGPPSGGGGGSPGAGSGGGGGSAGVCADLVPAFGPAVEQRFDTGTHRDCSVATTSTSGQVALGIGGSWGGFAGTMFALYSSDGSVDAGWVDGIVFPIVGDTGQDVDPSFHPTSGGYAGIVHPGTANPLPFRTWDASGRLVAEVERFAVSTAPDRNGGSILLARAFDPSNDSAPPGPTRLEWIDASGTITRAVSLDRDPLHVISSWLTGHVVVLVSGSPGSARWFDEGGSPLTPWFDVGDMSEPSLHLLVDGTVAVRSGGRWQVALADGAASAGAAPPWLASRPFTRLATVRQGRAYAVLPMGGWSASPSAGTTFEIVAASGQGCGSFSAPPAPDEPGVTKEPARLDVGQDGTLLQRSELLLDPNPFGIHCAFRWWPGLLQ